VHGGLDFAEPYKHTTRNEKDVWGDVVETMREK
jgi:hypothetical protein